MDENLLRSLFDFQRFAGNLSLDRLIRSAEFPGGALPLSDGELEINAAGESEAWRPLPGNGEMS